MMGLVSGNRLNRFWKKGVKPIKDAIGVLAALSTVDKETLVGAINELAEGKFDVAKLVASTNITEPGFAMDGKTASEAITELYSKNSTHPIGSIYHSTDPTDPSELFGGEWESLEGYFLLGASDTYPAGSTGGEATHTLTVQEMPNHCHGYRYGTSPGNNWPTNTGTNTNSGVDATLSTGGSQPHNNMPPYLAVYMWRRVA